MPLSVCILCTKPVQPRAEECPHCGLSMPAARLGSATLAAPEPRRKAIRANRAPRSGRRWLVIGLICFSATGLGLGVCAATVLPLTDALPTPTVRDPAQVALLNRGEAALRQALSDPSYNAFANSFLSRSSGHVVSLCGTVDAYADQASSERYVEVIGAPAPVSFESEDPSFETLWDRACQGATTPT
jgi:predicted benzoate:H+ symporter BenE